MLSVGLTGQPRGPIQVTLVKGLDASDDPGTTRLLGSIIVEECLDDDSLQVTSRVV